MPRRGRTAFDYPTAMFVTTTAAAWERLFDSPEVRDKVEDILFGCVDVSGVSLMGYCLMPNHAHLIAGHNDGGPAISAFVGGFKSIVSRRLFPSRHGIWMKRFDDVVLRSEAVFLTKLNYIHENPVRAGLVSPAANWKWSSARFWLLDEPSAALTNNWNWLDAKSTAIRNG